MHEWIRMRTRGTVAAIIACLFTWPVSGEQGRAMASAPLELIVKFSSTSEAGRRVERLLSQGSQDLGGLAEAEAQLETSTGVPFTRQRITSGREILFSIPERPLLERVEKSVARRADVDSAELVALQNGNPRLPVAQLRVRFEDSSDARELLERAYDDGSDAERVRALTNEIASASGIPVSGVVDPHGVLILVVERRALLETLSARVNDLGDVDYAQPNATMQIMK